MNSGQPPPERLRPTLQLKIKANSWNEFRPTPIPTPPERLRPTLQLKIKANSWNGFRPTPPSRIEIWQESKSSTDKCGQLLHWWIQGGHCGACPPPTGSISFIFAYIFAEKCTRRRLVPPNGSAPPPNGKSWIRHCLGIRVRLKIHMN